MRRFVSLTLVMLTGCYEPDAAVAPVVRPEAVALEACRAALRSTLIDPGSAQFSDEALDAVYPDEWVFRVTLNAKNRMGGYAGPAVRYCRVDRSTGRVSELV